MAFGIARMTKQKGGGVGSSGHHNDRTRETPNADPERQHLNRVLVGNEQNVREAVSRIIEEHGGRPRRDSVEAVEYVLTASPEWFVEQDPEKYRQKVDRFVEQAVKFLEDPRSGGKLAKAVLHMDERTPHVQAHKVPIDPEGKLNAKHYFGGRGKMVAVQDLYHEYTQPLGLERGRRGSRATHQRVKQFYASIDRDPELKIEPDRIPNPGRLKVLTAEGARAYKMEVLSHVLEQIREPVRILQDQSQLTRDERAHRVEADKRAAEAERLSAERIEAAEREAEERIAAVRREEAERYANLRRQALQIYEENKELHREKDALRDERNRLHESLLKMTRENGELQLRARGYHERLTDIPMPEVMERLGYTGERHGEALVYRVGEGQTAMIIRQQKAYDHRRELICKDSLALVVHVRQDGEGVEGFTHNHALEWLRDEFGEKCARGAAVVHSEHSVLGYFDHQREERQRALVPERGDDPWRGPQGRAEDRDRISRAQDSHDDHGGRGGR
ncbi:MAG: MobV family relaxase [Pyrinomonadaceae bacterium]